MLCSHFDVSTYMLQLKVHFPPLVESRKCSTSISLHVESKGYVLPRYFALSSRRVIDVTLRLKFSYIPVRTNSTRIRVKFKCIPVCASTRCNMISNPLNVGRQAPTHAIRVSLVRSIASAAMHNRDYCARKQAPPLAKLRHGLGLHEGTRAVRTSGAWTHRLGGGGWRVDERGRYGLKSPQR